MLSLFVKRYKTPNIPRQVGGLVSLARVLHNHPAWEIKMEVEPGDKLADFGKEKENEARKRFCESAEEKMLIKKKQSLVYNSLEIVYDHICGTVVNIVKLLLI